MILLLDHEDSFVHTLARYVAELGEEPHVVRPGATSLGEIGRLGARGIILSPGPGAPDDCPLAMDVIRRLGASTPILGVCLGHQCIGAAYGASIVRARAPRHGMTSPILHDHGPLFRAIPTPFDATRYHSLVIDPATLPDDLVVTATAADDHEIMGVRHRRHPVEGVQFHPESILTEHGQLMIGNWLDTTAAKRD